MHSVIDVVKCIQLLAMQARQMHSIIDPCICIQLLTLCARPTRKDQSLLRTKIVANIHLVSGQMLLSIRIVSMLLSTSIVSGQMLLSVRMEPSLFLARQGTSPK